MFNHIFLSMKQYPKKYFLNDFISGIIVATLTIPVAMGYAQIAGVPPIYGLYASFLPTIAYAMFASSPQLIFGIDATASAITGTILLYSGLAAFSAEAIAFVPRLSFFTGVFLILFSVLKVDKLVQYISIPVVSGTMSGISVSIMVSQISRMLGADRFGSGDGPFFEKSLSYLHSINGLSVLLSCGALGIIIVAKRKIPKLPMPIILLVIATIFSALLHFEKYGVVIVGAIPQGFPKIALPDLLNQKNLGLSIAGGFVAAVVGIAGSLLPSQNFANRNNYQLDNRRELFAYGFANLVGSFSSSPPTSASVSRTAASEDSKGKTQFVSVVAALSIAVVFIFLSGYLYYMPQPVLSAIVFASLLGVLNLKKLFELFSYSKIEALIWLISIAGVLLVGVLMGIFLGVVLSFLVLILDRVSPDSSFLGIIESKDGYYDLQRNKEARGFDGVLIYRYSSSLTFVNVRAFVDSLEKRLESTTQLVIIDASVMTTIDTTAAKEVSFFLEKLDQKGIEWYFSNVMGPFRERLTVATEYIFSDKHLTKTIDEALLQSNYWRQQSKKINDVT